MIGSLEPENMFNRYFGPGMIYDHTFQPTAKDRPIKMICDLHEWMTA